MFKQTFELISTIYSTWVRTSEHLNTPREDTYIWSARSFLDNAPGLSILLPKIRMGIPFKEGLLNKSWSSSLETGKFS